MAPEPSAQVPFGKPRGTRLPLDAIILATLAVVFWLTDHPLAALAVMATLVPVAILAIRRFVRHRDEQRARVPQT
jgi:hypothetical protein